MTKFSFVAAIAASLIASTIATPVVEIRQAAAPSSTSASASRTSSVSATSGSASRTTTAVTTAVTSTSGSAPTNPGGLAPTSPTGPSPSAIRSLQQALLGAVSEQQRLAILLPNPPDASNITYQFVNNTHQSPTGGIIALSEVEQFPALVGTKVAMAIGFVDACGLNVPHSHPRANEFLTVVQGSLIGGLVVEQNPGSLGNTNGVNPVGPQAFVNATLTNYKGMLFPQGSTHFQFNPTCSPAVFAAAFDNNDPGRAQIARTFFSVFPDDVILSSVGGDATLLSASQIDQLRAKIPSAFAELIDSCVQRCKGTS